MASSDRTAQASRRPIATADSYSPREDDDEIQAIAVDPKAAKGIPSKKTDVLFNYDCHPTKLLRDCYNSNLKLLIYAGCFNVAFVFMYMDWRIFLVDFAGAWLPLILNLIWILLNEDLQKKTVSHQVLFFVIVITQAILVCLFIGALIYLIVTMFHFEYKELGYDQSNMWIWTSLFLAVIATLNALHGLSFMRHLYHYRRHN